MWVYGINIARLTKNTFNIPNIFNIPVCICQGTQAPCKTKVRDINLVWAYLEIWFVPVVLDAMFNFTCKLGFPTGSNFCSKTRTLIILKIVFRCDWYLDKHLIKSSILYNLIQSVESIWGKIGLPRKNNFASRLPLLRLHHLLSSPAAQRRPLQI